MQNKKKLKKKKGRRVNWYYIYKKNGGIKKKSDLHRQKSAYFHLKHLHILDISSCNKLLLLHCQELGEKCCEFFYGARKQL